MPVVEFEHPDLSQHHGGIFQRLAAFRQEGKLCDVVVKSREGTQHRAHMAVLCAASVGFENMLLGNFREADQVQQGQPVEIAASDAVVAALLEYAYGRRPKLELEDSIELLGLADAYDLPQLAMGLETGLRVALDDAPVATAFKILQQTQGLHDLKDACEEKIAEYFETCIEHDDFLTLTAFQLARVLKRDDLKVSREEAVFKGLFKWLKASKDRAAFLGLLLQHVDLQSLSSSNLIRVSQLSASMGQSGHDLQREVDEVWRVRRKIGAREHREDPEGFQVRPKRRCLKHWSPELGASTAKDFESLLRKIAPNAYSMCCHEGAIYVAQGASIMCRKPGEDEFRVVAGEGATVNGVNDLGSKCAVAVSPAGTMFVADRENCRLLSFENGSGKLVLSNLKGLYSLHCSATGALYVNQDGGRLGKLVGASLQPVLSSQTLPPHLQFDANDVFEIQDNVLYISDCQNSRILRLRPSEKAPTVIGECPHSDSELEGLQVTKGGKVYVADSGLWKLWAFDPDHSTWTRVLQCPPEVKPTDVVLDDSSLVLNFFNGPSEWRGVYEVDLPAELQLE